MSDSLWPHESQHARPPCPSPTPGVHSNSCPSSQWCHPAISPSVVPFSSCPQSLTASVFSNESTLHMRWPKYWSFSFSISPSKEHPGLISFRSPQIKPYIYGWLIFHKSDKTIQWGKNSLFNQCCWDRQLIFTWKRMKLDSSFITHIKINSKEIKI